MQENRRVKIDIYIFFKLHISSFKYSSSFLLFVFVIHKIGSVPAHIFGIKCQVQSLQPLDYFSW